MLTRLYASYSKTLRGYGRFRGHSPGLGVGLIFGEEGDGQEAVLTDAGELVLSVEIRAGQYVRSQSGIRPDFALTKLVVLFCLAMAAVALVGCADADESDCPEGTELFASYELFMGRSNQSGEVVDDAAWSAILEDAVTPRFPDGLTVLDG